MQGLAELYKIKALENLPIFAQITHGDIDADIVPVRYLGEAERGYPSLECGKPFGFTTINSHPHPRGSIVQEWVRV